MEGEGLTKVKWTILILLTASLFAQTIRPSNVVTTDNTKANTIVGPLSVTAPATLSGNTTLTGQNTAVLYNLNGDVYLDGQKYATFAAAIAALPTGGTLRIAAGTYSITAQVAFVSNLDIECSPNNQTILQASASLNASMFLASSVNHFRMVGCVIDGNKGGNSNQFALFQATNSSFGELSGNHFQNGQSRAVWIAGGNSYIRVTGNEVDHYGQALPASIGNEGIAVAAGSGVSSSHITIDHNRVHDGNLGIGVLPSSGASDPTIDVQIASNSVYSTANDGILVYGDAPITSPLQGVRIIDNDVWCGGWPANGTGFSTNCTAGYLQSGGTASSSGVGIDVNSQVVDQPQVIGNRAHDMFFEGIDINPQTATSVSCNNTTTVTYVSGDSFNTAWKANQGARINGTFYNISSVAGATTTLTLATNCPTGTWGFTGVGYSRATVTGNYAYNNGHGNASTSGAGFSDSGYADTWVNNIAFGNNFVGFIDSMSSFVSHTGDKALDNDKGGGSNNGFLCQQCLNPSYVNIAADDSTGAHQTIGISISGGTNNAFISSNDLPAGATIADSGTATNYLINGTLSRSGVTDTVGAGAAAGNCTVGSTYHNSTAASASTALYVCQPANTWTAVTVP
jgi:hypothetical protein